MKEVKIKKIPFTLKVVLPNSFNILTNHAIAESTEESYERRVGDSEVKLRCTNSFRGSDPQGKNEVVKAVKEEDEDKEKP